MKISEEDRELFRQHLAGVIPLAEPATIEIITHRPQKTMRYHKDRNKHAHLVEDIEAIWLTRHQDHIACLPVSAETPLYFQRQPIPYKMQTTLKSGRFATSSVLDLHGMNEAQAEHGLSEWLIRCRHKTDRFGVVVHGKGNNALDNTPILKNFVNWWLRNQPAVTAFCSAQAGDGGTGAVYVLMNHD